MKLRLLVGIAGGVNLSAGDLYECNDDEGRRMLAARFAVPFIEDRIERAVAHPVIEKRKKV